MTNKLYEQHDDERIEAIGPIGATGNTIDILKRRIIELEAEIVTLKARLRDMG